MDQPLVSIVITTRNRCEELKRAIRSCLLQSYKPLEILVYNDASADQTETMVKSEFPDVRLITSDRRVGLIVLRNHGFSDAGGEFVFSLDDDAYFINTETVKQTVLDFTLSDKIAAVAIPFIEGRGADAGAVQNPTVMLKPHDHVCSYRGCAHAVRRSIALEKGGYREFLVHQGEERDLCIRLIESGYDIICGSAPPIVHDYSASRTPMRMRYYGIRNTLLFDMVNIPLPYVWGRFIRDAISLCFYMRKNIPLRMLLVLAGLGSCMLSLRRRKPVSRYAYQIYRSLPGHGPVFLDGPLPSPLL